MRLTIKTKVGAPLPRVKEGFNKDLFLQLSPPFPKVEIHFFEGSSEGDLVSLKLNFLLFKQTWTSKIVSEQLEDNFWEFIDEGTELPFFLKSWQHRHQVKVINNQTFIVDAIDFNSGSLVGNLLLYPGMLLQFLYRKPIYKRIFAK